jgi:DNA-binding HxlR family transcriptional regulator
VEYSLTELGKKIIPIFDMMHSFGVDYLESQNKSQQDEKHCM